MAEKRVLMLTSVASMIGLFNIPNIKLLQEMGYLVDVSGKRKEIGIPNGMLWILAVGELSERKNHANLIRAVAGMEDVFLTIAGQGGLKDELEKLVENIGIGSRVRLLGFRTDISELCEAADVFAFPSYQEGLPVALMEAMASGLPLVTSNVHGINDYSEDGKSGYQCSPDDVDGFADAIGKLMDNPGDCRCFGIYNQRQVRKYHIKTVNQEMERVYQSVGL